MATLNARPERKKVTVVGAGYVGSNTARRVAEAGLADEVVLIDVVDGLPQGLALDINQSGPVERFETIVVGTNAYPDTSGSDVVVITAGVARKPGMNRADLLEINAGIVRDVTEQAVAHSPDAVVIVVSNPLDEMTYLASEVSGLPRERVMGMAGVLDSSRLRFFISERLGVARASVEAMTLGSHGDHMVALVSHATVEGKPLPQLLDPRALEELFARTRDAGAEIVGHLKKGSAYFAPASSTASMVNAVLGDTGEVLPASVWTSGQYGISGVYLGLPARLGRGGVAEIIELDLGGDELSRLTEAARAIRAKCRELPEGRR